MSEQEMAQEARPPTIPPTRVYGKQMTEEERRYVIGQAFKMLDATRDDRTLSHFADDLWRLCGWERDRARTLDDKAAKILGTSGVVALAVTLGTRADWLTGARLEPTLAPATLPLVVVMILVGAVTCLFFFAALLAVIASRPVRYGGFLPEEVFEALTACDSPVGITPAFTDRDPHRCYLRELSLQRWLIYQWHCKVNDQKARWVRRAQAAAIGMVLGLFLLAVLVILSPWWLR
jgi:hypothetical protein